MSLSAKGPSLRASTACLTYPDDAAQLVEEQVVVPACVQALLYVAVQLVHHSLHVRVLVLEHKDNVSEAWLKRGETPGVGNGLLQQLRALAVDRLQSAAGR